MTNQIDAAALRALLAKATQGPWEVDSHGNDERYHDYFIGANVNGKWATLFDSVNSDEKLIEEEYGEDSYHAWDEVARRNAALIVAAVNALPALLDEVEALRAALSEATPPTIERSE